MNSGCGINRVGTQNTTFLAVFCFFNPNGPLDPIPIPSNYAEPFMMPRPTRVLTISVTTAAWRVP